MGMEMLVPGEVEMGQMVVEEDEQRREDVRSLRLLKARPGILLVGPPSVGKRSLLNRLVARERSMQATSKSGAICKGWTIDTKYYSANVCMWIAQLGNPALGNSESIRSEFGHCEALVMIFDMSNSNSFEQLQEWVTTVELADFEILLCVGNKADRVPEHFGHTEYRRKLQKKGESSSDPHPEFLDFGIDRTEGNSLLDGEEESVEDRRRSCIEWCSDRGIEYIEACAINEVFDECISVDGDLQGVARIHGALSAHMWPGLVMKDQRETDEMVLSQQEQEMTSDDDSDYYIEYELLSNGSAEPWDASGWEEQWSFASHAEGPVPQGNSITNSTDEALQRVESGHQDLGDAATNAILVSTEELVIDGVHILQMDTVATEILVNGNGHAEHVQNTPRDEAQPSSTSSDNDHKNEEAEDMEQLMSEMLSMRMNMRSMSDQHRREMAARLAMRMASMFSGEDEEGE